MSKPEAHRPVAVDVVFPCLNEALSLPWLLGRLPDGYRAIVADNGSTDGSADLARELGATVLAVPVRGYGAAAHAGLEASTADVVCFCDADGSLDPAELPRVADPVARDEADLVIGRRRPTARRAWPAHARWANAVLSARLRRRTGLRLHDLGPMRAGRRAALRGLDLADRRFGYPLETVVAAAGAGLRVAEVDVAYAPRTAGSTSKVTGTLGGTVRTVVDMGRVLTR
ncbi:glycosyltransferase family 2 protein [Cryptosporangium arvum]|uniref:Glycosyl transferase n=1 Tax=Cryptosporangium arvum DSM 44712 TaxID=927661 RepID=A0A011AHR2_9ACTN|nr:glycosyltransferase family 2 protein [Cryptosporangium arvum]EXG81561.1 glycosyl transferase [Cryptosporangium arvum DSM 44712]